jgi:hypothetical protein
MQTEISPIGYTATVKFGSSLNSIADGEAAEDSLFTDPIVSRRTSICFLSPGDYTRASTTESIHPDFSARTVYVPP